MQINEAFFNVPYVDKETIRSLNENGYAVIGKMEKHAFEKLKEQTNLFIRTLPPSETGKQLLNLINASHDVKLASNRLIKELFNPILEAIISPENSTIYPVSHILKPFGLRSDIWHQDSSIVDERKAYSFNAWMSLVPSTKRNGCLWVVPGSHKNDNHFRQFGYNPVNGYFLRRMKKKLVPIEVDQGEILLFHRNILHGSSRNWLPKTRIALESVVVSKGAQLYNFHREEALMKNKIIGFKVDMEHFLRANPKEDFYNNTYPFDVFEDPGMKAITEKLMQYV